MYVPVSIAGTRMLMRPLVAIIPFWTFSTFHVATFARSTLIPKFIPPVPNPSGSGSSSPPVSKAIQFFIKKYYDPSMKVVSYVEVAIFARVLFGLLLRSNSLLTPIVYGIFLRSRYYQSPFTREAFKGIDSAILQALSHPQVGGAVPQATAYYNTLKTYLARAAGNLPAPTAPPASATAADTSSTPRASSANPAQ
ncbi:hypothetical protein FRC15_001057 [Serendipita sp. 397]|nr:hypothetical protein FRC15_001057 [Serendipita sp. 397]